MEQIAGANLPRLIVIELEGIVSNKVSVPYPSYLQSDDQTR